MNENVNLNSLGSNYAAMYGHGATNMIKRVNAGRKVKNAAPKQFYIEEMMKKRKRKKNGTIE